MRIAGQRGLALTLLICQFQNFTLLPEGGQPISERLRRRTRRPIHGPTHSFCEFLSAIADPTARRSVGHPKNADMMF